MSGRLGRLSSSLQRQLRDFVAAPQPAPQSSEVGHGGKQVLSGKRLLHQGRAAMGRRQLLPAIAADKGEGNVACFQRVGDAADRLAGEMNIEQRPMHVLLLNRLKRVADRPGRADHGKSRLLEHTRDIERDEEFVLNDEDPCRCHSS